MKRTASSNSWFRRTALAVSCAAVLAVEGAAHPLPVAGPWLAQSLPNNLSKPARDPLSRLRRWADKRHGSMDDLSLSDHGELVQLIGDLSMWTAEDAGRAFESMTALLDLSYELRVRGPTRAGENFAARSLCSREVDQTLRRWFAGPRSDELFIWLATHVLSIPRLNPLGRRVAALEYMRGRYVEGTLLAVLDAAKNQPDPLRRTAIAALVGWPHPLVHGFMAEMAVASLSEDQDLPTTLIREHFETIGEKLDEGTSNELGRVLGVAATSNDWRKAVRAISTLGTLPNTTSVQPLIESLSVWIERNKRGKSSKRVIGAILHDLEQRSGRRIGEHPERWARWWQVAQSGQITTNRADDPRPQTAASFFGLRPMTDRVVFVIDRSGSMKARFGSGGKNSRHSEAIEQMIELLREMGPEAKFSVVLFSDEPTRWSRKLQPVTEANLDSAERWARTRQPEGGTQLLPAIRMVMELDRRGKPDLEALEADTVIVLCDGQTARGSNWVSPLLKSANPAACLVFHCVQIGNVGNGTLQQLAEESGGDFVSVRH